MHSTQSRWCSNSRWQPTSSLSDENEGKTIIAGYHWFNDWGRDTMISPPGLTLCTGRPRDAAGILRAFARFIDRGRLPNNFADCAEPRTSALTCSTAQLLQPSSTSSHLRPARAGSSCMEWSGLNLMRADIQPGATFPDYELPDQTGRKRRLSELQADDPMILHLSRGHF